MSWVRKAFVLLSLAWRKHSCASRDTIQGEQEKLFLSSSHRFLLRAFIKMTLREYEKSVRVCVWKGEIAMGKWIFISSPRPRYAPSHHSRKSDIFIHLDKEQFRSDTQIMICFCCNSLQLRFRRFRLMEVGKCYDGSRLVFIDLTCSQQRFYTEVSLARSAVVHA